ncbi:MAG: Cell division protein FtsA [Firmicutes bacterium]|nr:Cell division protein FtsA [candidate division NPL-UPA2 bacterium]
MPRDVIASLDVGTATTRCILAEVNSRSVLRVVGVCQRPSQGLRKGLIIDVDACARTVQETVSSAEGMAGVRIGAVHVALSPLHATLQPTRGVVTVQSDKYEVSDEDIVRVIQAAKVVSLPPNREIVDIIPGQYIVDGYGGLKDPSRMVGMRLELDASLVVGNLTALSTLRRTVERAGYSTASFVLKPLALGELVLSPKERDLGVQLVDVGAGVTEMAYFEEGALKAISVLPIGGGSVSNDLAVGLKISLPTAEKVKTEVDWFAMPEDQTYDLQAFGHIESRRVQPRTILDVLEPRLEELLELIRHQGASMSGRETPPAGIVLTGGVLKTKALARLAERYLSGVARVKLETYDSVDDPGYNTALAIAVHIVAQSRSAQLTPSGRMGKGVWARVKDIWHGFWE